MTRYDPSTGNARDRAVDRGTEAAIESYRANAISDRMTHPERMYHATVDALDAAVSLMLDEIEQLRAMRGEALALLADAIPDPKGAIDSPQWHRRMDRLAASLDDETAREFNDARSRR